MGLACSRIMNQQIHGETTGETAREIPVANTVIEMTQTHVIPKEVQEELVCEYSGSNNYIADIKYINAKIDEVIQQGEISYTSQYNETVFLTNIIQSELKTNISNFNLLQPKIYASTDFTITTSYKCLADKIEVYTSSAVNDYECHVKKHYPAILRALISESQDYRASPTRLKGRYSFTQIFNTNIKINIKNEVCVQKYDYDLTIYINDGFQHKSTKSQCCNLIYIKLINDFVKFSEVLRFVFAYLGYGIRNAKSLHIYSEYDYDIIMYLFTVLLDVMKHDDMMFDKKDVYSIVDNKDKLHKNTYIPYCDTGACVGGTVDNKKRCNNIILYGNNIISQFIKMLHEKQYTYSTMEIMITKINITDIAIEYICEVLKKYDVPYSIYRVKSSKGETVQYRLVVGRPGVPVGPSATSNCPDSSSGSASGSASDATVGASADASAGAGSTGTSKILLTIPSTCDLTDDLSIATDKSTGSTDSFTGLLQRIQNKQGESVAGSDGLRQRRV